jgi:hypothetical protein
MAGSIETVLSRKPLTEPQLLLANRPVSVQASGAAAQVSSG